MNILKAITFFCHVENQSKIEEELVMLDNIKMLYLVEPDRLTKGPGRVGTFMMSFGGTGILKV